jgi:PAS domain S-box-containing protein
MGILMMSSNGNFRHRPILRIVFIYALVGGLWIYFSDSFLLTITHDPVLIKELAVLKGLVFIFLTSLLLYALIARHVAQLTRAESILKENEIKFRLIFENSRDAVGVSKNGIHIIANPAHAKMFGYDNEQELTGCLMVSLIAPSQRGTIAGYIRDRSEGKDAPNMYLTRGLRKNGTEFDLEIIVSTYRMNGELYTLSILRDISVRRKIEETLRQSEEYYRMLFHDNPLPLWVYDRQTFAFLDVNDAAVEHYGYTKKEFLSMTLKDLLPTAPEEKEPIREFDARQHRKKDGTIVDVEITTHDLEYKQRPARLVLANDVTSRKKGEEELRKSETMFRLLSENAADVIWVLNPALGKFTYVSPSIYKLRGYTPEEVMAQPIESTLLPENVETVSKLMSARTAQFLQSGLSALSFINEVDQPHKNGSIVNTEATMTFLRNQQGEVEVVGVSRNITERKRAETLMRQSEEKFRIAFLTTPDSVNISRMEDGRYVSVNKGFCDVLGYSEAESIGKTSVELNIWAHAEDRERMLAELKKRGKMENQEFQFRTKDGRILDSMMSASVLHLDGVPHIVSIAHDMTEQKKLQRELFDTQKMVSIGTLAGGIAHDFNNILNIILGYSTLLEKRKSNKEKFDDSIHAITQAVERGTSLVRQILTFARKTDVTLEPISVYDVVHELFSMLQQTFPKTILFNERLEPDLPALSADHSQLHQVLLNLCLNARDAMPRGGTLSIAAYAIKQARIRERFPKAEWDEYLCVQVEDTGEGMNEETRSRMFDPFFTTKEKGKGTGLGLAVVYGIIQSHHGFIEVESEPNRGTIFRIYLPLQRREPAKEPGQQIQESVPATNARGTETVLVVEDEDLLLELVRTVLEQNGYSVLEAVDGQKAIEVYRKNQNCISAVITDLGLPGMSGSEEFGKLREINPSVKVIVASGFFDSGVKEGLTAARVDGFIQKPYKPDEIVKMLREILDRK